MIFENLSEIEALAKAGDLAGLEALRGDRGQSVRYRPPFIRSALMVSAHKVRHLNKLDELEADIAVINLEDGVAPPLKPLALRLAGLFLSRLKKIRSMTVVRINPLQEGGSEEIAYLNEILPDAIRIPKIESVEDVQKALRLIDPRIEVHLSIETAGAWRNLSDLRPGDRVRAWYLGILDLTAALKLPPRIVKEGNPTTDAILSRFLLEASAAGVLPLSFVYQDYKDLEGFASWCRYEREMGFHAKGCISPAQVAIAHRIFTPSEVELEWAEKVIALFESNEKESGFVDEELGFVDEPIYKQAKALLKMGE